MKKKNRQITDIPDLELLEEELSREKYRKKYKRVLISTISSLITIAAIAVLVANLWMPVLQIYGHSMTPTLEPGNIIISVKGSKFDTGDVVAFYYNNKILVKRVIAGPGDWIDIEEDGTVYVNNKMLDEPYVSEKALGDCNIRLPYQVPDERLFVMGDHRSVSADSRSTAVGCIAYEQVVGRVTLRVWPLNKIGPVN